MGALAPPVSTSQPPAVFMGFRGGSCYRALRRCSCLGILLFFFVMIVLVFWSFVFLSVGGVGYIAFLFGIPPYCLTPTVRKQVRPARSSSCFVGRRYKCWGNPGLSLCALAEAGRCREISLHAQDVGFTLRCAISSFESLTGAMMRPPFFGGPND